MCEVRLEKMVSSKADNWVRCTLAKLVISSHFEPSYLIIHTEILFSYHEISNGWTDWAEHPSWLVVPGQGGGQGRVIIK